jgi:beta-galactosidase
MQRFLLLLAVVLAGCSQDLKDGSLKEFSFNEDWEFVLSADSSDVFKDSQQIGWQKVMLPHTPVIEPLVVNEQWQGICWYRKRFIILEEYSGRQFFLRFEGAMNVADVWVNGRKKTTHLGGYLPFVVDLTGDIRPGEPCEVLVRLDNTDNPVTGPKPLKLLDFNTYGGLYRDVILRIKNPVFITDPILENKPGSGGVFVTFPMVTDDQATVRVKTHIRNNDGRDHRVVIAHELWKGEIKVAVSESGFVSIASDRDREYTQEFNLSKPELWSPDQPNLYHLITRVASRNSVLDTDTIRIGIRKFEFDGTKFLLNGREMFLRGINRHQEYPYIGYALSNEAQYRDALKIKEAGFDYVRLSHYPQSPAFMDACDELGLLVLDAIPGWQYYNEDPAFHEQVLATCRDMIRRDRNHPCVLAWEVSLNESWMPEGFIDRAIAIAHEEYPGDQCFTAGWINYGYDIYLQARQHRLEHYRKPLKPYIVSEYGDWEYYALNAGLNQDRWDDLLPEARTSRQLLSDGETRLLQQATNVQEAHNDNLTTPAFADGYWVMFDYNRGYADDLETSGIMSIERLPKFSYHFFRSQRDASETSPLYSSGAMVFITSYWDEASSLDIRVFSNCEEVELSLNGELIARQAPDRGRMSVHLAHPPFTFHLDKFIPGTLSATGFIGGKAVARHAVTTAGNPVAIKLTYDESRRPPKAGCKDVIFIYANLVDEKGIIVPVSGKHVHFTASGNGEIINAEGAQCQAGIASALLRIGNNAGTITVTAMADGLPPTSLEIPIQ